MEWHFFSNLHQTILMDKNVFRETALPEKVGRDRLLKVLRRKCFGAVESTSAKIVLEPVIAVCCFAPSTKPALSAGRVYYDDMVSCGDFVHLGTWFEDNSGACKVFVSLEQQLLCKLECQNTSRR
jgi:hypothetical protein